MKKLLVVLFGVFGLLTLVGVAFAHPNSWFSAGGSANDLHERMSSIMENGSYIDFLDFRKEVGFNIMPWVTDESSFGVAKEMHKNMEEFHGNDHAGMHGSGMMSRSMAGNGCPMRG